MMTKDNKSNSNSINNILCNPQSDSTHGLQCMDGILIPLAIHIVRHHPLRDERADKKKKKKTAKNMAT